MFELGRRVDTPDIGLLVIRYEERHDHSGRVAFVAGKKLGNAVWRNRAKRRMRALCRDLNGPFPGYDVVFVARRKVNDSNYDSMKQYLQQALIKAGIIVG